MKRSHSKTNPLCFALLSSAILCLAPTALAQNDDVSPLFAVDPIFRDGLQGFESLDGRGFSLKRSGNEMLFKFVDEQEVWALDSVPGPRGDEFLKNDIGRIFVRLTDLGGVILYDAENPQGRPVDPVQDPMPIGAPKVEDDLEQNLSIYLTVRLKSQTKVRFGDHADEERRWIQDAARTAAEGLVRSETEARALVSSVHVRTGPVPELELEKSGLLTVYVAPDIGYAGRPSTDRVVLFLKNGLAS
ncbi:MAG: hypothetical protein CMK09_12320 [Ponticaulis sp.]|nr:hypothetical protein [Ponticaulis sp.]|tara:strand:+ start:2971 stop:3705 length:735 start_codon:yes stop_codon:yes gene_type:complete